MGYNCTLFKNTGFNTVNIPDSLTLLQSVGTPLQVPSLEIVQDRVLSSIRVHATWNQVEDTDYVLVNDFLYTVSGIRMLNGDTAELTLIPDYITSAGGVNDLTFIDGITERVHVTDDAYAKYVEHDELMAPAEPLKMKTDLVMPDDLSTGDDYCFVEATFDVVGNITNREAHLYTVTGGSESVAVPTAPPLQNFTGFRFGPSGALFSRTQIGVFDASPGVLSTFEGIQNARDLGIESSIIAQYIVPHGYIHSASQSNARYSEIVGVDREVLVNNLPYEYGSYTPVNKKVLYSDFTPYGILSASGNRAEFYPADIYDEEYPTAPYLRIYSDPRPDGKPYFRYSKYKGLNSSGPNFFINSIAGCTWEQLPLVYQGKSGNALSRMQFKADRELEDFQTQKMLENGRRGAMIAGAGQGFSKGYGLGSNLGEAFGWSGAAFITGGAGAAIGAMSASLAYDYIENEIKENYKQQVKNELLKFTLSTAVVAPELTQPYEADLARDMQRNGCWCYRLQYTENDMRRIDKLLTMYGYKHVKALEQSDFTSRQDFNFVVARGVQVTGNSNRLPRWWCEGIAAQLEAGTRVWHVAPSPTHYNPQP